MRVLEADFPPVSNVRKLKTSFHETYIVQFASPLPESRGVGCRCDRSRAIVQVLGAELVDKPIFCADKPLSAAVIEKAVDLARSAGVRVPVVLASGSVASRGRLERLGFVVHEFIRTDTVEDEVIAPDDQWHRIVGGIKASLTKCSYDGVSTEPLGRFETHENFIDHLKQLAGEVPNDELGAPLEQLRTEFRESGVAVASPTLLHQDLNGGNVLCSAQHADWQLDALIDFESAVVGDSRLVYGGEPLWRALRAFGHVVKGCWLAARIAQGRAPRCEALALAGNHDKARRFLAKSRGLTFRKWHDVLQFCAHEVRG